MSDRITAAEATTILRDLARGREDGNGGDVWPLYDRAEDAMRQVIDLTRERDAAEMQRDDAARKAEEWRESHDIERTRADAAEAECARLTTERDAARAEAAGLRAAVARTTPPTEAEAAAHNAALGWWLISRAGVCPPAAVDAFRGDGDVTAHLPFTVGATWLPLDASGRPCVWPTPALGATGEGR